MTLPNHSDPAALEDAVIICALGLETQLLLAQCLDYGLLREAKQAQQFYERARQQKLPTVIDRDGIIRIYDPKTNSFGVYNADGTTRTFFKPRAGARYFQNVINDVLSRGGRMLHPFQPTGGTGRGGRGGGGRGGGGGGIFRTFPPKPGIPDRNPFS